MEYLPEYHKDTNQPAQDAWPDNAPAVSVQSAVGNDFNELQVDPDALSELFKAMPGAPEDLSGIRLHVASSRLNKRYHGATNADGTFIVVNVPSQKKLASTLVHEIKHSVDIQNGLSAGTIVHRGAAIAAGAIAAAAGLYANFRFGYEPSYKRHAIIAFTSAETVFGLEYLRYMLHPGERRARKAAKNERFLELARNVIKLEQK